VLSSVTQMLLAEPLGSVNIGIANHTNNHVCMTADAGAGQPSCRCSWQSHLGGGSIMVTNQLISAHYVLVRKTAAAGAGQHHARGSGTAALVLAS
jgi:hypothetical protein